MRVLLRCGHAEGKVRQAALSRVFCLARGILAWDAAMSPGILQRRECGLLGWEATGGLAPISRRSSLPSCSHTLRQIRRVCQRLIVATPLAIAVLFENRLGLCRLRACIARDLGCQSFGQEASSPCFLSSTASLRSAQRIVILRPVDSHGHIYCARLTPSSNSQKFRARQCIWLHPVYCAWGR